MALVIQMNCGCQSISRLFMLIWLVRKCATTIVPRPIVLMLVRVKLLMQRFFTVDISWLCPYFSLFFLLLLLNDQFVVLTFLKSLKSVNERAFWIVSLDDILILLADHLLALAQGRWQSIINTVSELQLVILFVSIPETPRVSKRLVCA